MAISDLSMPTMQGFGLGNTNTPPPYKPIQPSFRGVPFYCQSSENTTGRRLAVHEFVKVDLPYAEDLGRKGRKFTLNCFVIGSDWETKRDKLIDACEKAGPGIL